MSTRTEAVKDYISRGWVPFLYAAPFSPGKNWQHSTPDTLPMDAVEASDTPIGLVLGKPSQLAVIDIDIQNGGSAEAMFERYGGDILRGTRVVKTPSGGWHLYFRYPEGVGRLPKVINAGQHIPAIGAVDFLADGHHVQAPPSTRIGHPSKPDGSYWTQRDQDVAELPPAILADWQAITGGGEAHEFEGVAAAIPPSRYEWVRERHRENLQAASDALIGDRDNVAIRCIASSVRIAHAVPDDILSISQIEMDYSGLILTGGEEIKDIDGKILRAVEWASDHPWEELPADELASDLPDDVHPEHAWMYYQRLAESRVADAVREQRRRERIERDAQNVEVPLMVSGDAFVTDEIDLPEWIITGMIHNEGKTLLSAQYKAGKSTMMLEVLRSLTTGTDFLGHKEFTVPRPVKVAYYDMELGRPMAHRWLRDASGIDHAQMFYISALGRGASLDMRSDALRAKTARQLRENGVEVLIIDPASPVMSALGIDENAADQVRPWLDSLDMLAVEAGLKSIVLTVHTGHQETNRARGSSAWSDWPTALWSMKKHGEDQDARRSLSAWGRDVFLKRRDLEYHGITRRYHLGAESVPDIGEDYLTANRGYDVIVADVAGALGCTLPTARTKLEGAGYFEAVPGVGRKPAIWRYREPVTPEPFE